MEGVLQQHTSEQPMTEHREKDDLYGMCTPRNNLAVVIICQLYDFVIGHIIANRLTIKLLSQFIYLRHKAFHPISLVYENGIIYATTCQSHYIGLLPKIVQHIGKSCFYFQRSALEL